MAFGRLRANIRELKGIMFDTKLIDYEAAVLPTLLHACDTLTYTNVMQRANHFYQAEREFVWHLEDSVQIYGS